MLQLVLQSVLQLGYLLPFFRITIPESFGKWVAGNFELGYLQLKKQEKIQIETETRDKNILFTNQGAQ